MGKFKKMFLMAVAAVMVTLGVTGCGKSNAPVSLLFKYTPESSERTVVITNRSSSETAVVRVAVSNSKQGENATCAVIVKPGKTYEMDSFTYEMDSFSKFAGKCAFWIFAKGEVVTLTVDGYPGKITRTIP